MMQKFIEAGYEIVDFEAKAEIYVIIHVQLQILQIKSQGKC